MQNTGLIKPRTILAIDTSGPVCSVAVASPSRAIDCISSDGLGDHFEKISQLVSELLKRADIPQSEVAELRVGIGPGSFTGLRIGLSFAKGFAFANQIPLVGCCSFLGLAYSTAFRTGTATFSSGQRLMVVADARREELFIGEYSVDKDVEGDATLVVNRNPCIVPLAEVVSWREHHREGRLLSPDSNLRIPGLGETIYCERDIARGFLHRDGIGLALEEDFTPWNERGVVKLAELEPNYLRAVAAKTIKERQVG
jgi:tRNA threonylcarbamoyl adenosine modification protein YeaZ